MNLENLFSPGQQFYGSQYTQQEYDRKVDWIGMMIAAAQVQVAALVEVGELSQQCITDVMNAANQHGQSSWGNFSHEFRAQPGSASTNIRTAVISRFPLTNTTSLTNYPAGFTIELFQSATNTWVAVPSNAFSRPIAVATVNPPNNATPFNVLVVHLKSKRPRLSARDNHNQAIGIARSAIQRNAEAAALRFHLDTFLPQQFVADKKVPTFVVGDFNDTPSSVPLENIRGAFQKNPAPSSAWSAPDRRRLVSCARLHLKKAAYEDKLFSYVHNENFTLIDQMFVTPHLVGKFKHMELFNDHVLRHGTLSASTDQEQQWKSEVSDHGAAVAEFTRMLKT